MTVTTTELAAGHPGRCVTIGDALEADLTADRTDSETAVLQYTSGSTGVPKGVLVTHSNYLENLRMLGEVGGNLTAAPTSLSTFAYAGRAPAGLISARWQ